MPLSLYYLDDETILCENFHDEFASSSVFVKTFTDPGIAIQSIQAEPPDLLFLDYRLPGTTGDAIAHHLNLNIPICLITGDISIKTTYKFAKIFTKPYRYKEIEEFIIFYGAQRAL